MMLCRARGDLRRQGEKSVLDRNYRDIVAGMGLALFGLAAALYAGSNYTMGTVSRMGPGMMPVSLGLILAVFGLAIALPALSQRGTSVLIQFRPLIFLSASVLAFALMIERFGLVPSVFATTIIATLAETRVKPLGALILACSMSALTWALFVAGLRLSIPAFDWSL